MIRRLLFELVEIFAYHSIVSARVDRRHLTLQQAVRDVWRDLIILFMATVSCIALAIGTLLEEGIFPTKPALNMCLKGLAVIVLLSFGGFIVNCLLISRRDLQRERERGRLR